MDRALIPENKTATRNGYLTGAGWKALEPGDKIQKEGSPVLTVTKPATPAGLIRVEETQTMFDVQNYIPGAWMLRANVRATIKWQMATGEAPSYFSGKIVDAIQCTCVHDTKDWPGCVCE